MSHYTLDELIARWKKEELTVEQMIGQLLLVLRAHEQRLREVARQARATKVLHLQCTRSGRNSSISPSFSMASASASATPRSGPSAAKGGPSGLVTHVHGGYAV